jgi:hypothetical protein
MDLLMWSFALAAAAYKYFTNLLVQRNKCDGQFITNLIVGFMANLLRPLLTKYILYCFFLFYKSWFPGYFTWLSLDV